MNDDVLAPALEQAGLVYVSDREPGILRRRRGRGFCYHLPDGGSVTDTVIRQRIKLLGIPPAYRNVWICLLENGHLQATGIDDRGRKQYRYHADWQLLRDGKKYSELVNFGEALPRIRRRARTDADIEGFGEIPTLAALVLLLDAAHLRVGNSYYLEENGTYGATTLLKRHLSLGETVELKFVAKGGKKVRHQLRAPRLQKILERIADLPGRKLFVWQDEAGAVRPVESGHLNRYLAEIAGVPVSAKTFRTWGGTVAAFAEACDALSSDRKLTVKGMAEASARELANTPTISRKSYIHPRVLDLAGDEAGQAALKAQLQTSVTPRRDLRAIEERLLTYLESTGLTA